MIKKDRQKWVGRCGRERDGWKWREGRGKEMLRKMGKDREWRCNGDRDDQIGDGHRGVVGEMWMAMGIKVRREM